MSVMVDLARQAKRGINFVLPLLAGGTGRIDGLARGTIIEVHNSSGSTISRGMALKINTVGSTYPVLNVTPTTAATDRVVGFALEDIPAAGTGLMQIVGVCTVLTTGDVAYNEVLYPSATTGRLSATPTGGAGAARSRQATTGSSQVQADITSELVITSGDLCEPRAVVPGSFSNAWANANDQDTDGWDGAVTAGLIGAYLVGFDFMQAAQHPLTSFRWNQETVDATPQDFTSLVSDAAGGSWRMQAFGLANPDPDVDAGSHFSVDHAADGWSIHSALLFTGISEQVGTLSGQGTGTSASLAIETEPGDIVVACVAMSIAAETITDGASQTRRFTGSGGFVNRLMAVSTKEATDISTGVSFSWTTSGEYSIIAVALRGDVTIGDGHADIVGTGTKRSRCDHAHHVIRDRAPTVDDDTALGYPVLTFWTDSVTFKTYLLIDGTEGAAVWIEVGATTADGGVAGHEAEADPHTQYQRESEKGAASGYASLDGSTKVPYAQLPVGTTAGSTVADGGHVHGAGGSVLVEEEDGAPSVAADTIKFPIGSVTDNGDGSVSVSTSGGSGTVRKRVATSQTSTSTTFADVTALTFPVTSGKTYHFRFVVFFFTAAATTGLRLSVNGPTTSALRFGGITPSAAAGNSTAMGNQQTFVFDNAIPLTTSGPGATGVMALVEGTAVFTASGTLALRFASEVGGSQVAIEDGSYGEITEIV